MINVIKIDRITSSQIGEGRLNQEQFDNRALNKSVVALPVEDIPVSYDQEFERQSRELVIPDLSDLEIDVPVDAKITMSYANTEKTVSEAKALVALKINHMRSVVAHGGIIFSTKNFTTDSMTIESINLIATALLDGETFPGGTLPWDTMETPTIPRETFNATEAQFKSFRNTVAAHFVLATKTARLHLDAIDALSTFVEVTTYDYSTDWPTNPDMSEPV